MFAIRTPDPTRITKVTISYAMFAFPAASVDIRNTLRPNVDHSRMTCEARPTCEVDRLAWSEQLSDLSTVAVWRGSALGLKKIWNFDEIENLSKK